MYVDSLILAALIFFLSARPHSLPLYGSDAPTLEKPAMLSLRAPAYQRASACWWIWAVSGLELC